MDRDKYNISKDECYNISSNEYYELYCEDCAICEKIFGTEITSEISTTARELSVTNPEYDYQA